MPENIPASSGQMGAEAAKESNDDWDNDEDWGSLDDVPTDRVGCVHILSCDSHNIGAARAAAYQN